MINIQIKKVKSIITNSPVHHGFTTSPYAGCEHNCKYCYAQYLKDWTNHESENWGGYVDVKMWKPLTDKEKKKLYNKDIFISSATDPYQPLELEYKRTKTLLEELIDTNAKILIATKNKNVIRDMELFKKLSARVALSINTTDENFRSIMDNASTINERFETLEILHKEGIYSICFISPIFPGISDVENIIKRAYNICDEIWLEHLVLCKPYKDKIMYFIRTEYPELYEHYDKIFNHFDFREWEEYSKYVEEWCINNHFDYGNKIKNFRGHKYEQHRKI